jgi:hypothetical protein
MGRTESKNVANQGMAQSKQDQANAQTSLTSTNTAVGDYSKNLNNFMKFGRQTYGANGEYMRDQNTLATTTAAAGANNLKSNLALNAMRTGENTGNYADTVAESQRQSSRDLTNQLATADANRLQQLTAINQYGVQASQFPATVQAGLYGTSVGGAGSQLSAASGAAKTPGFWDTFAPALAQGAGAAAAGICPCAGSRIALANDHYVAVEDLKEGDFLYPMGSTIPPNPLLKTPVPQKQPCFEIVTVGGLRHRASRSHTVALAYGGYAEMHELMGHTILCGAGVDRVVEVIDIGEQMVYPMAVGGSHCYMADGIWILA